MIVHPILAFFAAGLLVYGIADVLRYRRSRSLQRHIEHISARLRGCAQGCCDHPLQHAIHRAINAAPYIGAAQALQDLSDDVTMWEDEQ